MSSMMKIEKCLLTEHHNDLDKKTLSLKRIEAWGSELKERRNQKQTLLATLLRIQTAKGRRETV